MSGGISYRVENQHVSKRSHQNFKTKVDALFFFGRGHPTKQEMMSATLRSAGKFWDGFWATIAQRRCLSQGGTGNQRN